MKVLKRYLDFYLDASIHVAIAIYALIQVSGILLDIQISQHLLWFLFFGSISCYNFVKYGVEAEKYLRVANAYHKNIQYFSFVTLIAALYHAYFLNLETYLGIGVLIVFTGLYALPVLPKAKNLRSWGGLKIFVVALVWSGATVVLPVLSEKLAFTWDHSIEAFQRFLLVLILLVPFEIRDLQYDEAKLKTIPQRFGVANTKFFGAFLTLLFFFSTLLKDDISITELISKGVLFLLLGTLMFITKRNQNRYFASFWVESIPLFWWALLLLLHINYK